MFVCMLLLLLVTATVPLSEYLCAAVDVVMRQTIAGQDMSTVEESFHKCDNKDSIDTFHNSNRSSNSISISNRNSNSNSYNDYDNSSHSNSYSDNSSTSHSNSSGIHMVVLASEKYYTEGHYIAQRTSMELYATIHNYHIRFVDPVHVVGKFGRIAPDERDRGIIASKSLVMLCESLEHAMDQLFFQSVTVSTLCFMSLSSITTISMNSFCYYFY